MPRCLGKLLVALSLGLASPALAQDAAAPDNKNMLELNGATDTEAGGCQLTIVATNQLETGIRRAAWQVAIFDKAGAVQSLPSLGFGGLIAGQPRVGLVPLPDRPCAEIGRIVVNDVAECTAEDGSEKGADLRDICLGGLATQTRKYIDFGL